MKTVVALVGGVGIGFGLVMIVASLVPALKASFDVSLFGLAVAVISLGMMLLDKAKGWTIR